MDPERTASGLYVLQPGEARVIPLGAFDVLVHADAAATDGAFALIETDDPEVGGGPPLHVHRDCAESFYVIEGAYRMHIDGRDFACPAGSFIYVPAGVVHTFQSSSAGSRKLNLYTPSGMVGYFDALREALAAGVADAQLDAIADRFQMDIVGPVPEGYV